MANTPYNVAWITHFPLEWREDLPEGWQGIPKGHPMTWQRVLLDELAGDEQFNLHIVSLSKHYPRTMSWTRGRVTFHAVKMAGGLRAPTYFWYDTLVVRRLLIRIQPDVVHAWGAERGAGLVADRLPWPYLMTVQGLMTWYVGLGEANAHERLAARMERQVFARAPVITTESRFAVSFIRERFPAVRIEQIEHAPAWPFHRMQRQPPDGVLRCLFVGTPIWRKGFDTLLAALDRIGAEIPWELAVTGTADAAYPQSLKHAVSSATWSRIAFLGNLPAEAVARELSRATMLVFPTRADTSPNAVKEAAVAGVPVMGTKVGGIPDYIIDGKNGSLVEPGNTPALADAIRAAWRHPLFGKGRVDEATLAQVREYLSPRAMARRFAGVYTELGELNRGARG